MTWFKVDDAFSNHPKVAELEAGRHFAESIALWTLAGSWSAHHLTDGFVPMTVLRRVVPFAPVKAATELVRVGLWEAVDGGYQFKDWIHYQPTKQEVEASRATSAKRSRKYRELQKSRVASRVTEAVTNGVSHGGRTLAPSRPVPEEERVRVTRAHAHEGEPIETMRPELSGTDLDRARLHLVRGFQSRFEAAMRYPWPGHRRSPDPSDLAAWMLRVAAAFGGTADEAIDHALDAWFAEEWPRKAKFPWKAFCAQAQRYFDAAPAREEHEHEGAFA